MRSTRSAVDYVPLWIILAFYLGTYALYTSRLFIDFPNQNDFLLFVYLAISALGIFTGYIIGASCEIDSAIAKVVSKHIEKAAFVGFVVTVVLFVPTIRIYTGQQITSLLNLLSDPASAYAAMLATITGTRDERLWFVLIKTAVSPLVVLAMPYYSYTYFLEKKNKWKLAVLVILMLMVSVFRGTDKEFFDTFILVFSGYLVSLGTRRIKRIGPLKLGRKSILIALAFFIVFSVFSFRKEARIGDLGYRCFKGTDVCHSVAVDTGILPQSIGVTMFARYLTQGYYGLSVALDGEFRGGMGFGHSRPLQYLGGKMFNSDYRGLLTSQLDDLGWDSRGAWSTGLVWIGNDVPLQYVPFVLFLLAAFLARVWREAIWNRDSLAVVLFVYLFFTFVYLPANLQLAQIGDLYFGFLFWVLVYFLRLLSELIHNRPEKLVANSPQDK